MAAAIPEPHPVCVRIDAEVVRVLIDLDGTLRKKCGDDLAYLEEELIKWLKERQREWEREGKRVCFYLFTAQHLLSAVEFIVNEYQQRGGMLLSTILSIDRVIAELQKKHGITIEEVYTVNDMLHNEAPGSFYKMSMQPLEEKLVTLGDELCISKKNRPGSGFESFYDNLQSQEHIRGDLLAEAGQIDAEGNFIKSGLLKKVMKALDATGASKSMFVVIDDSHPVTKDIKTCKGSDEFTALRNAQVVVMNVASPRYRIDAGFYTRALNNFLEFARENKWPVAERVMIEGLRPGPVPPVAPLPTIWGVLMRAAAVAPGDAATAAAMP